MTTSRVVSTITTKKGRLLAAPSRVRAVPAALVVGRGGESNVCLDAVEETLPSTTSRPPPGGGAPGGDHLGKGNWAG